MGKCFLHGTGGIVVERKKGTATPVNGTATVSVGFKPDLVVIEAGSFSYGTNIWHGAIGIPFGEITGTLACFVADPTNGGFYAFECTAMSSGFKISVYNMETNNQTPATNAPAFQYTAIKYT